MSSKSVTTMKPKNPVNPPTVDLQQQIRLRAYQLFEQRGRMHGRDLDDWLKAEAEVLRRTRSAVA